MGKGHSSPVRHGRVALWLPRQNLACYFSCHSHPTSFWDVLGRSVHISYCLICTLMSTQPYPDPEWEPPKHSAWAFPSVSSVSSATPGTLYVLHLFSRTEWLMDEPSCGSSKCLLYVTCLVRGQSEAHLSQVWPRVEPVQGWCQQCRVLGAVPRTGSPWGHSLWEICRSGLWDPPAQEGLAMVFSSSLLLSYTRTRWSKGKGTARSQAPPPAQPGSQGLAEPAGELESLLPSHQRTPTWVRARSQREPSSSFPLPHTLQARAVSALRTVIQIGTSNSLAEYWHSPVTWGHSFPSSGLTDVI